MMLRPSEIVSATAEKRQLVKHLAFGRIAVDGQRYQRKHFGC